MFILLPYANAVRHITIDFCIAQPIRRWRFRIEYVINPLLLIDIIEDGIPEAGRVNR